MLAGDGVEPRLAVGAAVLDVCPTHDAWVAKAALESPQLLRLRSPGASDLSVRHAMQHNCLQMLANVCDIL